LVAGELGDYDPRIMVENYVSEFRFITDQVCDTVLECYCCIAFVCTDKPLPTDSYLFFTDISATLASRLTVAVTDCFITELRPLKRVAREKWGTHDALRASRPGNEVVKAADVFGFL